VNGIGVGNFGSGYQSRYIQVAVAALGLAYAYSLIGKFHVQRVLIGRAVYRHGFNTHFAAGTYHPQGYFASVGYQYFIEHVEECEN
jgi:hypothetical protein